MKTRSVYFSARFGGAGSLLAMAAAILAAPLCAHAQDAPDDVLLERCAGPLGALLPECQAAAGKIDLPARIRKTQPTAETVKGVAAETPLRVPEPSISTPATPPPPAQPLTEFQRFVASSTGQPLPIFGSSLFESVPSTFAPLDRVPVTADYVVGPGDQVLLRVWGQVNLDLELTVDRSGSIFVPQAGNVRVAGLQFQQLAGFLRAQLEKVFRNFDLTVNLGELRSIQIFVVGQVRRPGAYTVGSLSTLVDALFASGGPSNQGSMRRIQLKRGVELETTFDLYDLLLKGDKTKDRKLLPGDVVYVPPAGSQVGVSGSVRNPAIYELNGEKTVDELLRIAGGLSPVADAARATLERIQDRATRETFQLSLNSESSGTILRDGDLLRVPSIGPRFANAVTLRGNVANPGRFPWRAGMRIRDVIPNKESLVTKDYWKKRNLLGTAIPETELSAPPAREAQSKPVATSVSIAAPDINWSYAVIERQNMRDLSTELTPFHLGRLVLEGDETQNLELRPGDVVTIFSQADIRVSMAQQTRFVRLEGEFNAAGIYAVRPGETLGQLVVRAGGLTEEAYLFGSEFTRESTRHDQQVRLDEFVQQLEHETEHSANARLQSETSPEEAAALRAKMDRERSFIERLRDVQPTGRIVLNLSPEEHDLSKLKDMPLEDGDRFVVPGRPSTVNVLGAVYNQNAFIHRSSLTVRDYLRQAGGASRSADKSRTFVIRADGTVIPRQSFGAFSGSFESMHLNAGDSVVVPETMFTSSFVRGLRDWTQIFTQLALGAAAVNILR